MEKKAQSSAPIRVSLVDDDDMVRSSLSALINGADGFTVRAVYAGAEEAIAQIPANPPDVLLMDINLVGRSGIECVAELHSRLPELEILMLTMFDDEEKIFESLRAGAGGYLLKRTPQARILTAIQEAYTGGSPMSPSIARKVVKYMAKTSRGRPGEDLSGLSPREREILSQLAEGFRYKEIADQLDISIETVRTHLRRIYRKLQVTSRTEATAKFLGR